MKLPAQITRRAFIERSTHLGIASATIPAIAGVLWPNDTPAASNISLSDKVIALKPSVTNCFLLKCHGGYMLIDVPYPGNYDTLLDCLRAKNVDVSSIRYLLLTHHHDDHVGCVNELLRDTDAEVIVHEKALPHLAAGRSDPDDHPVNGCVGFLVGIYSLFHEFVFPPVLLRDKDHLVTGADDTLLKRIGIDGEIIHTPGHTHDSISVILADGSAIVGDAAMNFMGFCGTRHRPIYVQDLGQTYESWEKLRAHGARVIYTAHGDPFAAEALAPVG